MRNNPTVGDRLVAGGLAATVFLMQLALPPAAHAAASSSASAGSALPPQVAAIQSFQPDLFTGRATTAIPIAVPPGRKGLQPSLALTYSSTGRNGPLGVGWSLDLSYIERSTKNGVPKYTSGDAFTAVVQGASVELVQLTDGTYRAKDEGMFLRFERKTGTFGEYWEVRDKAGTLSRFGWSNNSRIVNPLLASNNILRWSLDRVQDPNGNALVVSYLSDNGQLYPESVKYPENATVPNQVWFDYQTGRFDRDRSFRAGFEQLTLLQLAKVRVLAGVGTQLQPVRDYRMSYTTSGRSSRSLLVSVTPYGTDATSSLPTTTLAYESVNDPTYALTSQTTSSRPKPELVADVDGNGVADIVTPTFTSTSGSWTVTCGSPMCSFSSTAPWTTNLGTTGATPIVGDWNGDGVTDVGVYSVNRTWQFAVSNAKDRFDDTLVSSYNFGETTRGVPYTGDFNGDGVTDIALWMPPTSPGGSGTWQVALGNKDLARFQAAPSFDLSFSPTGLPMTGDFNGDGLTDLVFVNASTGKLEVRFSNGSGWVVDTSNVDLFSDTFSHSTADFNGDGLTDLASYDPSTGQVRYALSRGVNFEPRAEGTRTDYRTLPQTFSCRGGGCVLQLADFNGDGLADPTVYDVNSSTWEVLYSTGTFADVLAKISNGLGGSTTLAYVPSARCDNLCPLDHASKLPFIIPVVSQATVDDGRGNSVATRYSYRQGRFDPPTREFRGFGIVEVRDPQDTVTTTTFLQDSAMKGHPILVDTKDAIGNPLGHTSTTWSIRQLAISVDGTPVNFTRLDRSEQFICNGDTTCKSAVSRFEYDDYGNVLKAYDDGDPSITTDDRRTETTYAINVSASILGAPQLVQTFAGTSTTPLTQRQFYYDGAAVTTQAPTKGNLTREEEWLNPGNRWIATTLTYDASGNVSTVTDALGRVTTNTYDATGTFLTQITNHLGHTRQFTYDARFGQVATSTDANGLVGSTTRDVFGRPVQVFGPNSAVLPNVRYVYTLGTPISSTMVCTRITDGAPSELCSTSYADGLGRTIQVRAPAKDPTKQVVSGVVQFDNRGLASKQWVPYLSATSNAFVEVSSEPGAASLATVTYAYDAFGRLTTTTEPDASVTRTAYDDWFTTVTDAEGHVTRRFQDAFGRLAKVEEVNGLATYTTLYNYDALGQLIKVTDANGNLTTVAYDSLGRKTSMVDPDMGAWSYSYDDVDNLASQTDARGVGTAFAYDALNRVTQKSYTIPNGSSVPNPGAVTYRYDEMNQALPFTKGKLTSIADGSGSSSFDYDRLGRVVTERKILDGTTYTISRGYDLLGRLLSLTYPDGAIAQYAYNAQGGINRIDLQRSTGTQAIVSNIDYNAAGQITSLGYGNGVTTAYAYDPQTLRLNSLASRTATSSLQDLGYSFDRVGNVKAIIDRLNTASSQTFQYDGLNRLTQASGLYGPVSYQYDAIGNMLQKESATLSYGLPDRSKPHAVTTVTGSPTVSNLTYDANGNVLTKAGPITTQRLTFDAENRLTQVQQTDAITVTFKPGWNFFSLPLTPASGGISSLFSNFSTDFEQVAQYNPSTQKFTHYTGVTGFDDFTSLQYGVGYQVYCKNPSGRSVTFTGSRPAALAPALATGWQLLPATLLADSTPTDTFGSIDASSIQRYDTANGSLATATTVQPAGAYYVNVRTAGTWRPPMPGSATVSFVYDGDGGRVKQVTAAGTTRFLGQSYEIAPDGTRTKYVFAGSQRVVAIDAPPGPVGSLPSVGDRLLAGARQVWSAIVGWLSLPSAEAAVLPALRFYLPDHLGSTSLVTDATGAIVERSDYTPYGSLAAHTGPPAAAHKFTGQRLDADTGLYFYNARYYDPTLGRFVSADTSVQDPADPQTLNRYAYCRNNPLAHIDPSGYFSWKKFFGIAAAVVVAAFTGQVELPVWVAATFSAAVVAGAQAEGAAIDRAVARSSSQSSSQPSVSQTAASSSLSSAMGLGVASLGAVPLAAAAVTPVGAGAGGLGALTAGELAIPGVGEVVGGAIAGILLYQGAAAVREAYEEWNRGYEIIGYHATSFNGAYGIARGGGFKFDLSDRDGRARFGPGFYLASTPKGAIAELSRRGLTVSAVLEVRARLTRNIIVGGPLADRPYSRVIGAGVRAFQGSITYGSFADPGVTNYVLFGPDQVVAPPRVVQYGDQ